MTPVKGLFDPTLRTSSLEAVGMVEPEYYLPLFSLDWRFISYNTGCLYSHFLHSHPNYETVKIRPRAPENSTLNREEKSL